MSLLDLLKNFKKTNKEAKILVLGLDNAGKTTLLKSLSHEEVSNIEPTKGFNVKAISHENFKLNVWDLGGQAEIRQYWHYYFSKADGIIFVVDSSDDQRIKECNTELKELLTHDELVKVPVLVFANKQDLQGCLSADEIIELLELNNIIDRNWSLNACSAYKGEGVSEGMQWLLEAMANSK